MSDVVKFTEEMKSTHTILIPYMLPIHFEMIAQCLRKEGYKVELLKTSGRRIVDEGLRSVHNDTCYPALLVIGQMLDALKSGQYDPDKTALMITQTGGGCRASNYIFLLRKALKQSGFPQVPVISVNTSNLESNPGFKLTPKLISHVLYAAMYGDALMCLANQVKPYEVHSGATQKLLDTWCETMVKQFDSTKFLHFKKNIKAMIKDFEAIEVSGEKKIKVGIVGEIYMKYAPIGNNYLEEFLIREGVEPVLSGVMDFAMYCLKNNILDVGFYGFSTKTLFTNKFVLSLLQRYQNLMIRMIEHSRFEAPTPFAKLPAYAEGYISTGVKMGEGWLLTCEMLDLIDHGVKNIVCCQPFGCLPNHIVAKGMTRKIKDKFPDSNIVAIDYDPGATEINQENRLKLMLSNARANAERYKDK